MSHHTAKGLQRIWLTGVAVIVNSAASHAPSCDNNDIIDLEKCEAAGTDTDCFASMEYGVGFGILMLYVD